MTWEGREKTYSLLRLRHSLPTVSALCRNILRFRVLAKILRDLRPVVLHVQEVRGQSALRGIGIGALALLALVLVAGLGGPGARNQTMLVQRVGDPAGDDTMVELAGLTTQDGVGVVEVGARQVRDSRVQLRKAVEDLLASIVLVKVIFWWIVIVGPDDVAWRSASGCPAVI